MYYGKSTDVKAHWTLMILTQIHSCQMLKHTYNSAFASQTAHTPRTCLSTAV